MTGKKSRKRVSDLCRIWITVFAGILAAGAVIYWTAWSYRKYEEELICMEQEELSTMAETVGISLVNFITQELERVDLYFDLIERQGIRWDEKQCQNAAEAFINRNDGLYTAMGCVNEEGNLIWQTRPINMEALEIPRGSSAIICGKSLDSVNKCYDLYLSRTLRQAEHAVTVVFAMNLDTVYQRIVRPVRIGVGGYSIVKDRDLSIIMHHAPDQIGMDAVYDRRERYPDLYLDDLFTWIGDQKIHSAGTSVIRSYDWSDPDLKPVKRIVAYTTIHLPGETWIVNSTLPFDEISVPLSQMLYRMCGISIIFLFIMVVFVYEITKSLLDSVNQKKEISYLKEINEGMELLHKKDEEIQHYQRVQTLGQMSSHIAHEFNNYLTPVMVYGGLLQEDLELASENQELVKGILESAQKAADLSRKLLDFSRQDSGALRELDFTEEIRKSVKMLSALAPEKIQVETELTTEQVWVRGNKNMAEHILMNLCSNAFDSMKSEGGTLKICYAVHKDNPDHTAEESEKGVLLVVSDTGCGIPAELQSQIFEPFYTTKRSGKGTGLGLSVIKNMVSASGGILRLESEVGKGTKFSIWLPEIQPCLKQETEQSERRYRKIVLVDDDLELLSAMEKYLVREGHQVKCFDHPARALAWIQKKNNGYDVIITDYSMPSMNGLELASFLRRHMPQLRIILMSGQEEESFTWYRNNGMIDGFILKSEMPKALVSVI